MSNSEDILRRLRSFNVSIGARDRQLNEELMDRREELVDAHAAETEADVDQQIALESIVLRTTRPVLFVRDNAPMLEFQDAADSEIWKARLSMATEALSKVSRAVGRIELVGGRLDWVGTGWLVADNILVTNRHVALEFSTRSGQSFDFLMTSAGKVRASVDFLEEFQNPNTLSFKLSRPLHIEGPGGPDVAFFEVEQTAGSDQLAQPLILAQNVRPSETVATVGYPAHDSRIPDQDLMEQIYGRVYDKKRLAPGAITHVDGTRVWHNCTTLGGNSGSAVIDLDKGNALGLHFSGGFLTSNYAVPAGVIRTLLDRVRGARTRRSPARRATSQRTLEASPAVTRGSTTRGNTIHINLPPLSMTISIDSPAGAVSQPSLQLMTPDDRSVMDMGDEVEARPEDYLDRKGYQPEFLGPGLEVPLPEVVRDDADVLSFKVGGREQTELRYEHFSVVMSQSRRMCFLSAVNINGKLARKTTRVDWKWDPRLPREQQIMDECYGNPPKFSRGHMTRREDPAWGASAHRGNTDSMHVTNATPQMQAFNSPIWLALEDYALSNAKRDKMRISVFTGPYFEEDDPVYDGVQVPRAFWKVIAFIHDDTNELCATGYQMSQEQSLPSDNEYVFGSFVSPHLSVATQVSIRSIEERSGISFGGLADLDPLLDAEEGLSDGANQVPLGSFEMIRFMR